MRPPTPEKSRYGAIAGTAWRNASAAIWARQPMLLRTSPSACIWTRVTNAASISLSVRAFRTRSSTRFACTASCISLMIQLGIRLIRVHQQTDPLGLRNQLQQQPEQFGHQLVLHLADARKVA